MISLPKSRVHNSKTTRWQPWRWCKNSCKRCKSPWSLGSCHLGSENVGWSGMILSTIMIIMNPWVLDGFGVSYFQTTPYIYMYMICIYIIYIYMCVYTHINLTDAKCATPHCWAIHWRSSKKPNRAAFLLYQLYTSYNHL